MVIFLFYYEPIVMKVNEYWFFVENGGQKYMVRYLQLPGDKATQLNRVDESIIDLFLCANFTSCRSTVGWELVTSVSVEFQKTVRR